MKKKIKSIMFMASGTTAVFDTNGEQVAEVQRSWMLKYLEFLDANGCDYSEAKIIMPYGGEAELIKTETGLNWKMK